MPVMQQLPAKIGRLTILEDREHGKKFILCRCDCGKEKAIYVPSLVKRITLSCGCLRSDTARNKRTTHGQAGDAYGKVKKSSEYNAWTGMKKRCYNPNERFYKNYGGRGITVCNRWLNSFENFFLDMGSKPSPKHSIDRINNESNYEPTNCRWATRTEQNNNRRPMIKTRSKDELLIADPASNLAVNL